MTTGAPYSVRLDPDVAQQLAEQGGALLILDLPEGSYFGIDHMAFHCGPRFRGIKMLPPGPHFLCYSVPGSQRHGSGMGPITGCFFNVTTGTNSGKSGGATYGSVIVRRYDPCQELLVEVSEEDAERYVHGVRRYEFDWGLAPYNLNAWRQWRELTTYLDERVIDTVQPVGGIICTAMEASLEEDEQDLTWGPEGGRPQALTDSELRLRKQLQVGRASRTARATAASALGKQPQPPAAAGDVDMEATAAAAWPGQLPTQGPGGAPDAGPGSDGATSMEVEAAAAAAAGGLNGAAAGGSGSHGSGGGKISGRCFYSPLPRLVKEAGLTPAQLTALNLDRTQQLEALARKRYGGDLRAVVGEMQFAFIAFVFGQSMQGFRQWRALVTLFLNCESGPLGAHAAAFTAFIAALRAQLALSLRPEPGAAALAAAASGEGEGVVSGPAAEAVAAHGSLVEEVLLAGGGRDCFLRHHLATFFEVLREAGPQQRDAALQAEASELRAVLSQAVGWQFDGVQVLGEDDDDEYAPVVVELDEGLTAI